MTLRTHRRVAAVLFLATGSICQMASATTHTWKSADGTWGDATKWSSLPNGTSAEAFVGNGGTVSIAGGIFNTSSLHVGYVGTNNSGTGKIIVDSGSLTANGTVLMGEGNAGTLIINGGVFTVAGTNHMFVGGGTLGTGGTVEIDLSSGTFAPSKTGVERWAATPGVSTLNMSGGTIAFPGGNNIATNQLAFEKVIFSGGFINNFSTATFHELSGDGSISCRTNVTNLGVTIDQSIDTTFNGSILGQSSGGVFTKNGPGNLELGGSASITLNASINFNGGTIKVNRNSTFGNGTLAFAGGTLDLNGFTQTGSFLGGNGTIKLGGTTGLLTVAPSGTTSSTFDGLISGAGGFTKANSGTLILSASQSYTGNTIVSGGTLSLTNTSSNPLAGSPSVSIGSSGNVTVSATGLTLSAGQLLTANGKVFGNVTAPLGTTVRGSGTFNGALAVNGIIGTTNNIGTLTAAALTLNSASVNVELNANGADKVVVSNGDALTLNGTSTITLTDLGGAVAGTYPLFDYSGTALTDLGHLALASPTLGTFNVSLQYNSANTSIDLSVVSNITNATWNFNGDGNASDPTKWDGGVPNGIDQIANFTSHGGTITASPTVTLDSDVTLGAINFDHTAGSYTIAGGGTSRLILDVTTGQATVNVISGNHTISAPVVLNKDTTINATGSISFTGSVTATGKAITKTGSGAAQFENVRAGSLTVSGGALRIRAKGSPDTAAGTSVVNALSVTSGSIDLTNNAMVVNYSMLGTLPSDVRSALQSGELTTTLAAGGHALGYADNAVLGRTNFAGQTVSSTSFLIAYTFGGDANLDGAVNGLDFNALATNFGQNNGSQVWINGDFDYNGTVSTSDFTMLAQNFNSALPSGALPSNPIASLGALVPEPTTMTLVAMGAGLLTRRRRT